jgi:pimeloyl-ACP methyl ester carboxylesterase
MGALLPFVREAGRGSAVVCLHANASSSAQWRGLIELLAPRFRVFAPDLYDCGGPCWPSERVIALSDEAAFIEPVLRQAGAPLTLVGHSYGAALALVIAAANPGRVKAVAVYEPTLFSLLDAEKPAPNDADGIREAVHDAGMSLDEGYPEVAAERFIDYWMGDGGYRRMPESTRRVVAASMTNVRRWAHALFTEPTPLEAFAKLDVPVLYMTGSRSPASARGVARLLTKALPRVQHVEFPELGHMAPVTHPERVNEVIREYLESVTLQRAVTS